MTTGAKVAVGGVGAVLLYYLYQHFEGAAQISTLAAATTPVVAGDPGNVNIGPVFNTPIAAVPAAAPSMPDGSPAPDPSELSALLTWAQSAPNTALWVQMINELSATDIDTMYNILTTQWDTGAQATPANTAWWNGLRKTYPFINTNGNGCVNLQCN